MLLEFLESFDEFCQYLAAQAPIEKITVEDFIEYYTNLSTCVDDDEFAAILTSVWRLKDSKHRAALAHEEREETKRTGKTARRDVADTESAGSLRREKNSERRSAIPIDEVVSEVRRKLAARGVREVIGLVQELKACDVGGKGVAAARKLADVLREFHIDENSIESIIEGFRQRADQISYRKFIDELVERPNEFRRKLIQSAFYNLQGYDKMDYLPLTTLKGMYKAKNHPEVRAGMLAEDEAMDDFTAALQALTGRSNKVYKQDFENYYTYIGLCIPSDTHFESILNSVWPQPKKDPYGKAESSHKMLNESPVEYGKRMRTRPVYNPVTGAVMDYGRFAKVPGEKRRSGAEKGEKEVVGSVRASFATRGVRGVLGLYRSFRVSINRDK